MLGAQTIQIVRRSAVATDDYGLDTYSEQTLTVTGCLVAPAGSSDTVETNRNPSDDGLTLYLPAGTVTQAGDHYIIGDETYERDGRADSWFDPNGWPTGVVLNVKRRLG